MNNMLVNPQGLSQLGQVPLMYTNQAYDWLKQAQGADQATLADIMAQRQRQAQLAPIQQQQAEATLAQTQLGNAKQGYDNRVREATIPQEIADKLAEFASKADEYKWKGFQARVAQGVSEGDPKMVAIMKQMPAWQAERQKHQEEMELAKVRAAAQVQSANVAGASRVTAAGLPKPTKLSDDPWEAYGQLARQLAVLDENTPEAQAIMKQMAATKALAEEAAMNRAKNQFVIDPVTGKVTTRKPAPLPAPTAPTPAPQPAPGPQAPRPAPMQFTAAELNWLQRAKADPRNKGVTEQALIEFGMANGKIAKR